MRALLAAGGRGIGLPLERIISTSPAADASTSAATLTPRDLAARWRVTANHLANLRWQGQGPAFLKLGGVVRYRLADVEAYEDAAIVTTTASAA
jgi:hypothetical protein